MEYILWFDQVDKNSLSLAGGKASNLGEMTKLKLPVPPGFILTSKAFDYFLEANKIKEQIGEVIQNTDVEDTQKLLDASNQIKQLIVSKEMNEKMKREIIEAYRNLSFSDKILTPEALRLLESGRDYSLVAVRSSATAEDLPTASFAGQQATFLNVKGFKDLIEAIKKCWASLFEPRAIFYRNKQGFKSASIAVIIQKMVNSDKSGVMFTVNPSSGESEVVIEATWGLGETLVSGQVQPDMYRISKDGKIIEKNIGKKDRMKVRDLSTDKTIDLPVSAKQVSTQVLSEEEMIRLAKYGISLEEHYQKPQDIEFAIERGRIFIVQTRAVTTLAKKEELKIMGEPILKGLGASPGIAKGIVRIIKGIEDITKIERGDILVTTMTTPDLVPVISKSAAIVTDSGGLTSHAAIVSREMSIPAIVGTQNATKILQDGQLITVDAYRGLVYPGEVEVPTEKETEKEFGVEYEKLTDIEKLTATSLKVNLVFPEKLQEVVNRVDGVGLLRIEHMIIKAGVHPAKLIRDGRVEDYIKILIDGIKPIAQAFNPKPVWVRTLDARSDEFRNLEGGEEEPKESNPMLGWHGIRRSLDDIEILKAEFEAVKKLHEERLENVHIMFPFIISVDEFRKAKEIAEEIGLPVSCKLGIMIETPAAAMTIEDFCKEGIAFASFGTNDLSQLTLGIDRNNEKIAKIFTELHPSIKKMIKYAIKICKKYKVESSICGEAPSNYPEMVDFLVQTGIDSISVNIDAIEKVRVRVIKMERKLLLEALRKR